MLQKQQKGTVLLSKSTIERYLLYMDVNLSLAQYASNDILFESSKAQERGGNRAFRGGEYRGGDCGRGTRDKIKQNLELLIVSNQIRIIRNMSRRSITVSVLMTAILTTGGLNYL